MILPVTIHPAFAGGYVIAEGDALAIDVFGMDDLQFKEIIVRPDGKIDFPLIGEVQAVGRTPSELARTMTEQLGPFVKKPNITVNIARFQTTHVYVLGEVNRPGLVELQNQHNVIDAIGAAGSWTKDAAKKKVYLIRNGQKGDPTMVNLWNIVKKGDTSQNYTLGNGDILFLDSNGRLDWSRDIAPIVSSAYFISNFNSNNR
jgi:polysaccharide biosynthesis/export protein